MNDLFFNWWYNWTQLNLTELSSCEQYCESLRLKDVSGLFLLFAFFPFGCTAQENHPNVAFVFLLLQQLR
jgi:hypothetical protein